MPRTRKRRPAATQVWIGYCRKSTDSEDKQIHTLGDQAVMIEEYYGRLPPGERRQHPLRLLQESQSAYRPGRPVFQTVLQMADRGEVRGLIVVHPNRVSRNHADSGAFVQRLVEGAVPYLDTTGGKRYTGADSNDIFMLTLEGAMSWKDSRDKGDRIRQAMRMRASKGRHMGPVRIGYRSVYRPDGSAALEVVPESAPLIRRLFELAGSGTYSIRNLEVEADRSGLRSRAGRRLSSSAVHAILRDPLYKGDIRFDGAIAKGQHEPLVDEALWDRVQLVLSGRRTDTGRPKDLSLRDLFVFGNLLRCPHCGSTLCPYRVKGKYVYYECKNSRTRCGILVPQTTLVEQLPRLLAGIQVADVDVDALRTRLLALHEKKSRNDVQDRRTVNAEYEKVVREIGEVFLQRKEAEALGVLDIVDQRLSDLRRRRDELQAQLNARHEKGTEWVEKVLRSFRLIELLREAIFFGSRHPREAVLKALASNYTVEGKMLVLKLRSPFRQLAKKQGRSGWWAGLYDVRTEIEETLDLLQLALAAFETVKLCAV
jgi:DNA invertase Pin-like site-specific DNA recombinase